MGYGILGLLLPVLFHDLVALEVLAISPSIFEIMIQITAILVSLTSIVPKVLDEASMAKPFARH